jgi:hypothetical protein
MALPVADLPQIGPTYAGNEKNDHYGGQNQRADAWYFGKMATYKRLPDHYQIRAFYGVFRREV